MMNILYIGSSGALSLVPFRKLLSSQYSLSAVAVNNPVFFDNRIIALENESLALAAHQSGIPVIDLSATLTEVIEQCKNFSIDVILMSCYNKRLPEQVVKLAAKGCYNLHPSLLPRYRGPEPIFWQMKEAGEMGVSWHQVVTDFDAGDVVAQKKVFLEDGASYSDLSLKLAETGAELMLLLLSKVSAATLIPVPQNPEIASYYPYPEKQDFDIDVNGSARQIYNFMSATQVFSTPYLCQISNRQFYLEEVLDYDNNMMLETVEIQGNRLYIPCNEGVLIARFTDKIHQ